MIVLTPAGKRTKVLRVSYIRRPDGSLWPVLVLSDGRRVTALPKSHWVELNPTGVIHA